MILSDPASERAVLSSVFNGGGEQFADIADIVTVRTFTVDSNQFIWRCLESICKDNMGVKVDYPSIISAAKSLGLSEVFEKPEEMTHLRAVMNMPVHSENCRKMAGRIRKLEIARLLGKQLEIARETLEVVTGNESVDQIFASVENPIFDFTSLLSSSDTQTTRPMGENAQEYLQYLIDNPRNQIGISSGIKAFDKGIGGGFRPNSLDVIAARPKTGKSQLVNKIALHVAGKENIPVLNIDTEMSWEEQLHRVVASMSNVKVNDIERGVGDPRKVIEAAKKIKDYPYDYRCISQETFEDTLANMRRWVLKTVGLQANGKAKPCLIIYDYLKLMSADSLKTGMAEFQMLGFVVTSLKNFASRYGVPILCFAQLNRDGIDKEDTSVISQSDRIVWFCTSLSIFKWKSDEEKAEDGGKYSHKLIPVISRHGEGLKYGDYINMNSKYEYAQIIEGPTRQEMESGHSHQPTGIVIDESKAEGVTDFPK